MNEIEKHDFVNFLTHFSRMDMAYFHDFESMPAFMSLLNKIAAMQCESVCMEARGCSIPHSEQTFEGLMKKANKCDVLVCVEDKGYEGCWDAMRLRPVKKRKKYSYTYGNVPVENCVMIRDHGKDAVKPRGNQYYVWQQNDE